MIPTAIGLLWTASSLYLYSTGGMTRTDFYLASIAGTLWFLLAEVEALRKGRKRWW